MTLRLTLLVKFLLLLVPTFILVSAIGVLLIGQQDQNRSVEQLALRVGNLSARVASALGRHGAPEKPQLAEELLGLFGNEPAVRCAEWHRTESYGQVLARYPAVVGCKSDLHAAQTAPLVLPVNDGESWLSIQYSEGPVNAAVAARARWLLVLLLAALGAAVLSALVAFRFIIGRRLSLLHKAMMNAPRGRTAGLDAPKGADELADMIRAYNAMVHRERRQEDVLVERNRQLADQSHRDALTGAFNRRYFDHWCQKEEAKGGTTREHGVLALLDVDHFKRINDTHGHAVGDEVLVALTRRLSGAMRADDLLVRWGGEEFFIYVAGQHDIQALANRLLNHVSSAPIVTGAGELVVRMSVGLVALPADGAKDDMPLTIDDVLVLADRALYVAKARGRHRAVCITRVRARHAGLLMQTTSLEAAEQSGWLALAEVQAVPDAGAVSP
jgi:diguanylate cyclase (GGDEF)-like protein